MRLRNIPAARPAVENSKFCVRNPSEWKGKWNAFFGNENPIHVEIGMGKGQFILAQAAAHPDVNYLGLERYESVMYRAVQRMDGTAAASSENAFPNVRLICCDALEIADFFEKGEVERIYLNFSDPWPKARQAPRRLTHRGFLEGYRRVLRPGGYLEFKTDNEGLFRFSMEEFREIGRAHV